MACHNFRPEVAFAIPWTEGLEARLSYFWYTGILCPLWSTIFSIIFVLDEYGDEKCEDTHICAYFLPVTTGSRGAAVKG